MSPSRTKTKSDLATIVIDRGVVAGDEWVTVAPARIREALQSAGAEGYTF